MATARYDRRCRNYLRGGIVHDSCLLRRLERNLRWKEQPRANNHADDIDTELYQPVEGIHLCGQPACRYRRIEQQPRVATIGIYNSPAFFLRNSNVGGIADISFTFGPANLGLIPIVGDWNGDGVDTIGLYDPAHGAFFLRNSNDGGVADITFTFGPGGMGFIPIVGDWNGDGVDTVGLYDPLHAAFFLRNSNNGGVADITFTFGPSNMGFIPIVGDWDKDGVDTIGVYDPGHAGFFLRNTNTGGIADLSFIYGPVGSGIVPLAGNWDGQ